MVPAVLLTILCIAGAFVDPSLLGFLIACAAGSAIAGFTLVLAWNRFVAGNPIAKAASIAAACLVIAAFMFVEWPAYMNQNRYDYNLANTRIHGPSGELWEWVNRNLPTDARIAYTNMFMIHALGGFDQSRVLSYAATRPGLRFYHELPSSHQVISDEQIRGFVADHLIAGANREVWQKNLAAIRPQFLIVGKQDVMPDPPERRFSDEDPSRFTRIFENPAGIIYGVSGY
jgi:hypothetical protein